MELQEAFDSGFAAVKAYVDDALADQEKRIAALELRLAAIPPAKDVPDLALVERVFVSGVDVRIAELRAELKGLLPDVPGIVAPIVAEAIRAHAATLPQLPEIPKLPDIDGLISEAVAAIPKPQDGKSVTADELRPLIAELVEKAVAGLPKPKDGVSVVNTVIDRNGNLIVTLSDGTTKDLGRVVGRGRSEKDMAPLIAAAVAKAVEALPKPKDGERGPPGEKGADGAPGRDGKDGKDGLPGRDGERGEKGDRGDPGEKGDPGLPGKDGAPGKDGKDGVAGERGEPGEKGPPGERGEQGPPGRDGKDGAEGRKGDPGERGADGARGEKGDPGKDGIDGAGLADALIDKDGNLVLTMTDGRMKALGHVVGASGMNGAPGRDGIAGKDGADGLGFDDLETIETDEGCFLRFRRGDVVKDFRLPVVIDRGVYQLGRVYRKGDGVSFAGSFWIAQDETTEKPGEGKGWRLAVKKGRDSKEPVSLK